MGDGVAEVVGLLVEGVVFQAVAAASVEVVAAAPGRSFIPIFNYPCRL